MVAKPSEVVAPKADLERMRAVYERQRSAFARHPMPTLAERREQLERLSAAVLTRKEQFVAATNADYGRRPAAETLTAEIMTVIESVRYVRGQLRRWMRPSRRSPNILMKETNAAVHYQPLGVVGIISPWNYPLLLALRPLTYALAAGNRVMLKPSEVTARTSEVLREMIASTFAEDHVAVITGEAEVGQAFSALPFDHLLFTGSTTVGRHVMLAAARNLTPVTLELGGKSPTIIDRGVNLRMAAERICFGKLFNAGQTCVAPDYVLCPRELEDELITELRAAFNAAYPNGLESIDYTSVINERHRARLTGMLEQAKASGALVEALGGKLGEVGEAGNMPFHIVRGPRLDLDLMCEEIFGPILPIVAYDDFDETVTFVNQRERPLALNLFSNNKSHQRRVIRETHSGGMCINDSLMHVAVEDMPFGGVGASGMGAYQGVEGFRTFSNARGVYKRPSSYNLAKLLYPPYGGTLQKLIHKIMIR